MVPNLCRKALPVVLLVEMVSVIVWFSLEESIGAWPVHVLICELHLDGLYRLEFVFRPIAPPSLIRKGLLGLGLGDHRPSNLAEAASALQKLDAPMCQVLQGGLRCVMGLFLWRIDDDPFWKCGISILAFKNVHHRDPLIYSLSMVRIYLGRMFEAPTRELY